MDIRSIHDALPDTEDYLQGLYDFGIEQLNGYMAIEQLPKYPLDINHPKSQVVLKDFIGRVIEELFEGYESTEGAVSICCNYGWNTDLIPKKEYISVLNNIANANEEQADALGFFITLLVYSNILAEDILSYGSLASLGDVMGLGASELCKEHLKNEAYYDGAVNTYEIINKIYLGEDSNFAHYAPGFHHMSSVTHELEKLCLFDIVFELNKARNLLKSRSWKQTQVMTKELDFQESLVRAFYMYMGFLYLNGINDKALFELFFKKQRLNLWRQRTNY